MVRRDVFNLFAVAAILFFAVYYLGPGAFRKKFEQLNNPAAVTSAGTTGVGATSAEKSASPNPIEKPQDANPERVHFKEMAALAACKREGVVRNLRIASATWNRIQKGEATTIVIPQTRRLCLRRGQRISLTEIFRDPASGRAYAFGRKLRTDVVGVAQVRTLDLSEIKVPGWPISNHQIEGYRAARARNPERTKNIGKNKNVDYRLRLVILKIQSPELDLSVPRAATPTAHPKGKTYTAAEALARVANDQALLLDVRSRSLFEVAHHEKAMSYPFFLTAEQVRAGVIQGSTMLSRAGLEITGPFLKADRKKPIIFYGHNRADLNPYNAITLFSARGFRDLGWVPGGLAELQGFPNVPFHEGWKGVLKAQDVADMIAKGAILVDVRLGASFGLGDTARAAREIPVVFNQSNTEFYRMRQETTTAKDFVAKGIAWAGVKELDAKKSIILMGADKLDWRPWIARRFLDEAKIESYWYEGGVKDWMDHSMADAKKFPTRKLNASQASVVAASFADEREVKNATTQAENIALAAERQKARAELAARRQQLKRERQAQRAANKAK